MNAAALMAMQAILLPYQKELVGSDARFTWNCWSRQTGKSFASSMRRMLRGAARGRNQFLLSAGERQSAELMGKVALHCKAFDRTFELFVDEQSVYCPTDKASIKQLSCKLPARLGGIRVVGLPANPDTARGFTGDVLLDEFAIHKHDREIWAAMFPTVLRDEGEIDVLSTPKGKRNQFYALRGNEQFECRTITIHDAVAQGLETDVEALQTACGDDEIWRQEFLCEFIDGAMSLFTQEQLLAISDEKLPRTLDEAALTEAAGSVYVGIDIGRKRDLTVIWPFAQDGETLRSLGMIELKNEPFRTQFDIASKVVRTGRAARCCVDATGLGMQMAEELVEEFGDGVVEACTFTAALKAELATTIKRRVEDQRLRIPAEPAIRNDFYSVEKDVTAGGTVRIWSPRTDDSHADRFWAAALACRAASEEAGPVECTTGSPVRAAGMRRF